MADSTRRSYPYGPLDTVEVSNSPDFTEPPDWERSVNDRPSHAVGANMLEQRTTNLSNEESYDRLPTDDQSSAQAENVDGSSQSPPAPAKDAGFSSPNVYWKGNSWYPLIWDVLSVLVSLAFLGKPYQTARVEG
jgi:hypothetical protein